MKFERRKGPRKDEVMQIFEEDARPGRQLDQKPQNGSGLLDFAGKRTCGHRIYSRCATGSWDIRKGIESNFMAGGGGSFLTAGFRTRFPGWGPEMIRRISLAKRPFIILYFGIPPHF
jgi:hypothetical protein